MISSLAFYQLLFIYSNNCQFLIKLLCKYVKNRWEENNCITFNNGIFNFICKVHIMGPNSFKSAIKRSLTVQYWVHCPKRGNFYRITGVH